MNCHLDVINILLDHGCNINQVTDEGLSVLLACHILLYTKENFIENIAETMPKENLFNAVEIEKKTGTVTNRIERKMIMGIFEDIHRAFNNTHKSKITAVTALHKGIQVGERKKTPKYGSSAHDSRASGTTTSPTRRLSEFPDDESDHYEGRIDHWKMEFYQNSMAHVKEVDEINDSFRDIMLKNPHQYLKEMHNYHQQNYEENTGTSIVSSEDETNDGDKSFDKNDTGGGQIHDDGDVYCSRVDGSVVENDEYDFAFPTTVASIFGYDPATEIRSMTVSEQKHLDNEMVLKLINKERSVNYFVNYFLCDRTNFWA